MVRQSKVVALLEDGGVAGSCKSATGISRICFRCVERRSLSVDMTNEMAVLSVLTPVGMASLLNGV